MSYQPSKFEKFMISGYVRSNMILQLIVQSVISIVFACMGRYSSFSIGVVLLAALYLIFHLPMKKRVERKEAEAATHAQTRRDEERAERALREWRRDSAGAIEARTLLISAWQAQFPGLEYPLWLSQASTSPDDEMQAKILQSYYGKSKEIDDALASPYLDEGDRLRASDRQQALAAEVVEKLSSEVAVRSAKALQEALSKSYLVD